MAVITHTEILTLAAKALEAEIAFWEARCQAARLNPREKTSECRGKLEAVCALYRIETGTELR